MKHEIKYLHTFRDVINNCLEFVDARHDQHTFLLCIRGRLPKKVLDKRMDTCCGQSLLYKFSQIYPLIELWHNYHSLLEAFIDECEIMFEEDFHSDED